MRNTVLVAFAMLLLSMLSSCKNQGAIEVDRCSIYDGKKALCNDATNIKLGLRCEFDEATEKCVEKSQKACADLDAAACKASKRCTFDAQTTPKCNDAAAGIVNTCAAIQDDKACAKDSACEWENDACHDNQAATTVHTWKKIALPGTAAHGDITHFVVSGDNKHLYAFNNKARDRGLYHSDDDGKTWSRMGYAETGTLVGKPYVVTGANQPTEANVKTTEGIDAIKPTSVGAVVVNGGKKKLAIVVGDSVELAFDVDVHNLNAAGFNKIASIKANPIHFFEIVQLNAGESVILGQKSAKHFAFHRVTGKFDFPPASKETKKTNNTDLNETWLAAGNSHDGTLLLASANGVWEFPLSASDVSTGNNAQVTDDTPRIAPGDGAAWDTGATTPNNKNLNIQLVGSFADGANKHYFVGLGLDGANAAQGLAHRDVGSPLALTFSGRTIFDLTKFNNKTYLVTDQGLKGVNVDGTPNTSGDLTLDSLATNKNEMMEDRTALPFSTADNVALNMVYGDDNKAFYWVKGHGIFLRIKEDDKKPRH